VPVVTKAEARGHDALLVLTAACAPLLSDPCPAGLPIRRASLKAVLHRLSLPRSEAGVGGRLGHALADEAVAVGGAPGCVDALGGRVTAGVGTMPEVVLAIALLAVSIAIALWVAARIYAAGVLPYGQRPGLRSI
jgi:hypothetical protein